MRRKNPTNTTNEKSKPPVIPVTAILCFVYILFSMRPADKEILLSPEWTQDISHVQEITEGEKVIPFKLAHTIGYFTSDGKVVSSIPFAFKAAISDKWYASYSADNQSATFFLSDGTKAGVINEPGFPFFQDDRIFVMSPGGTSFIKCDDEGMREWGFEYFSPVTAFSSSEAGVVVGYADGTLITFTLDGKPDQRFAPGGSDFEVILGAGISNDGQRVACVSGQDPQRFVVAEKRDAHSKIIFHEYLEEAVTRQAAVRFSMDSDFVYFGGKDFLGVVDLRKSEYKKVPIQGRLSQVEFSDDGHLAYALSKGDDKFTVTVFEDYMHEMVSFSFEGDYAFIQAEGNDLFIGRDRKISKITALRN